MTTIRTLLLSILLLAAACGDNKQTEKSAPPPVDQPAVTAEDSMTSKLPSAQAPPPSADTALPAPGQPKNGAGAGKNTGATTAPPPTRSTVKFVPPDETAPSPAPPPPAPADASAFSKHGFVDVATLDPSIRLDIRYATADNFTKSKIYDCPRCLLRPEAAKAIVKAHKALQKKGYGLKMYDCYRPRPYQQRLWDKVPNPDYVTPPAKGSMHSRGAAVDLTVVDKQGKELDMGTPYDFFGKAAHTDNTNLPVHVLANRKMLREALEAVGFKGIRTEWWHFSYEGKNYPLSDYVWPCGEKK